MQRHFDDAMRDEFRSWLQSEKPDVILADMVTLAAIEPAKECGIPVILNIPGPLELFKNLSPFMIATFSTISFLHTRSIVDTRIMVQAQRVEIRAEALSSLPHHSLQVMGKFFSAFGHHLCLVNSFFGLDTAWPLPPNVIMTGSTAPRPSSTILRETSDERFNTWLQRVPEPIQLAAY